MKRMKKYIANTFSLGMINNFPATIKVSEVDISEIRNAVKSGATVIISHQSTAQVLSEILEIEVSANRMNIKVKKGDIVYVFQILQRPSEGQVFTTEEIKEIVSKGKYKVLKVEVVEMKDKAAWVGKLGEFICSHCGRAIAPVVENEKVAYAFVRDVNSREADVKVVPETGEWISEIKGGINDCSEINELLEEYKHIDIPEEEIEEAERDLGVELMWLREIMKDKNMLKCRGERNGRG